tara:strand:- start:25801 stop:26424 length:624 start_codon:yes stop_codon:yes gene_type:complete
LKWLIKHPNSLVHFDESINLVKVNSCHTDYYCFLKETNDHFKFYVMIWFDIHELERGLRNGEISDKVIFNYLLGNLVLYSIVPFMAGNDSSTIAMILFQVLFTITITVIGSKKAFDMNESGDSKDFFKRFLALSFVTGIRLFVFCLIIAIPIGVTFGALGFNPNSTPYSEGLFDLILMVASSIIYYYMLINSFKRVSHGHQNLEMAQ